MASSQCLVGTGIDGARMVGGWFMDPRHDVSGTIPSVDEEYNG